VGQLFTLPSSPAQTPASSVCLCLLWAQAGTAESPFLAFSVLFPPWPCTTRSQHTSSRSSNSLSSPWNTSCPRQLWTRVHQYSPASSGLTTRIIHPPTQGFPFVPAESREQGRHGRSQGCGLAVPAAGLCQGSPAQAGRRGARLPSPPMIIQYNNKTMRFVEPRWRAARPPVRPPAASLGRLSELAAPQCRPDGTRGWVGSPAAPPARTPAPPTPHTPLQPDSSPPGQGPAAGASQKPARVRPQTGVSTAGTPGPGVCQRPRRCWRRAERLRSSTQPSPRLPVTPALIAQLRDARKPKWTKWIIVETKQLLTYQNICTESEYCGIFRRKCFRNTKTQRERGGVCFDSSPSPSPPSRACPASGGPGCPPPAEPTPRPRPEGPGTAWRWEGGARHRPGTAALGPILGQRTRTETRPVPAALAIAPLSPGHSQLRPAPNRTERRNCPAVPGAPPARRAPCHARAPARWWTQPQARVHLPAPTLLPIRSPVPAGVWLGGERGGEPQTAHGHTRGLNIHRAGRQGSDFYPGSHTDLWQQKGAWKPRIPNQGHQNALPPLHTGRAAGSARVPAAEVTPSVTWSWPQAGTATRRSPERSVPQPGARPREQVQGQTVGAEGPGRRLPEAPAAGSAKGAGPAQNARAQPPPGAPHARPSCPSTPTPPLRQSPRGRESGRSPKVLRPALLPRPSAPGRGSSPENSNANAPPSFGSTAGSLVPSWKLHKNHRGWSFTLLWAVAPQGFRGKESSDFSTAEDLHVPRPQGTQGPPDF